MSGCIARRRGYSGSQLARPLHRPNAKPALLGVVAALMLALLGPTACKRSPADPQPVAAPSQEQCVEQYLAERHLNPFGDPVDTVYAGGTPLFDERTGERTDRLDYLARRHPDLVDRCQLPTPPQAPAAR
jgi:hypothetical protein